MFMLAVSSLQHYINSDTLEKVISVFERILESENFCTDNERFNYNNHNNPVLRMVIQLHQIPITHKRISVGEE